MSLDLNSDLFNNLRLELRRGLLIVAVLAQLRHEHYGYTLRKDLVALGIEIDEGTLYPLLRRLESQGLLESEWREENNRQKRFYKLSREGRSHPQAAPRRAREDKCLPHSHHLIPNDLTNHATTRSLSHRREILASAKTA